MSAFEDYCIVCEKLCVDGLAYCSENCKLLDQENNEDLHASDIIENSPALSASSFTLNNGGSSSNTNTNTNTNSGSNNSYIPNTANSNPRLSHSKSVSLHSNPQIPNSIVSPLLTPQIVPMSRNSRSSIVGSRKSPNLKDLTYESPLLATSNSTCSNLMLNDLDANRLDLNTTTATATTVTIITPVTTISERLSQSLAHADARRIMTVDNIMSGGNAGLVSAKDQSSPTKKITHVANLLHSSSENYKKWLSIH